MKKLTSLILAAIFSLSAFSGCSSEEKNENQLIMATNAEFPPFEFENANGDIVGIDIDIANAIAEKLGKELKVVNMKFEEIIDGVEENKYDFGMAGMTVKTDRTERVNFSNTYAGGIQVVIVRDDSEYTAFDEFYASFDSDGIPEQVKSGIKIGVQKDTTGDSYSSALPRNWGFGEENVVRFNSGSDAINALSKGEITAVIIDNEPAKAYVESTRGLKILDGAYADENYAICVSKENTDLLGQINNAIEELQEEGRIDEIVAKYISK